MLISARVPDWFYRTLGRRGLSCLPDPAARALALGVLGTLGRSGPGRWLIDLLGHMRADPALAGGKGGLVLTGPIGLGPWVDPEGRAARALARFGTAACSDRAHLKCLCGYGSRLRLPDSTRRRPPARSRPARRPLRRWLRPSPPWAACCSHRRSARVWPRSGALRDPAGDDRGKAGALCAPFGLRDLCGPFLRSRRRQLLRAASMAARIARVCSGVLPQHEPMMPAPAASAAGTPAAISAGGCL